MIATTSRPAATAAAISSPGGLGAVGHARVRVQIDPGHPPIVWSGGYVPPDPRCPLFAVLAGVLLLAGWPQLFGLERQAVIAQLVSLRGLAVLVAAGVVILFALFSLMSPRRVGSRARSPWCCWRSAP